VECEDLHNRTNCTVNDVCEGLDKRMKATYLSFRGKYFKQTFSKSIGRPVFVNLAMEGIEENFNNLHYFGSVVGITRLRLLNKKDYLDFLFG